jgi:hypothetical protein
MRLARTHPLLLQFVDCRLQTTHHAICNRQSTIYNQGVAHSAEHRRAMPEAVGAKPASLTIWPCRLPARTSVSQAGKAGSTPARVTIYSDVAQRQRGGFIIRRPVVQLHPSLPLPLRCCRRHSSPVPSRDRFKAGERPQFNFECRPLAASSTLCIRNPTRAGRLTGRHGRRNAVIRVRFPAGPPVASSSNGQDTCPSNRERGFDSRRGYHEELKMENEKHLRIPFSIFDSQFISPL